MSLCSKVTYATRGEALADRMQIRQDHLVQSKRFSKGGRPDSYKKLQVYRCPRCGQWHLSTKKQKRKY